MSDPLGLIGSGGSRGLGGAGGVGAGLGGPLARASEAGAPTFKDVLVKNLDEVNAAQRDATRAVEDLATGKRDDVESVILATEKADTAFRMLQAMRNKVLEAYREVQQIQV